MAIPLSPKERNLRARIAAATRYGRPAEAAALEAEFKTERAVVYLRSLMSGGPLTPQQRGRLIAVITDGDG